MKCQFMYLKKKSNCYCLVTDLFEVGVDPIGESLLLHTFLFICKHKSQKRSHLLHRWTTATSPCTAIMTQDCGRARATDFQPWKFSNSSTHQTLHK